MTPATPAPIRPAEPVATPAPTPAPAPAPTPPPKRKAQFGYGTAPQSQTTKSQTQRLSPESVRDNKTVCKARPTDNKPKGGGGGSKRFVPWKGTKFGC